MPELGQYATEVLSAYAASITVLVVLVIGSLWRAARVKAALARIEQNG